jgi:hypothetical protein
LQAGGHRFDPGTLHRLERACLRDLRLAWAPLLLGYTVSETAAAVGVSAPQLSDALAQLREELAAAAP